MMLGSITSGIRPPPSISIPRVARSTSGDSVSTRATMVEEEFEEYEENEEDLGGRKRRSTYLSGLQNLVPELKHATPVQT